MTYPVYYISMTKEFRPNEEQAKTLGQLRNAIIKYLESIEEFRNEDSYDSIVNLEEKLKVRETLVAKAEDLGIPFVEYINLELEAHQKREDRKTILNSYFALAYITIDEASRLREKFDL